MKKSVEVSILLVLIALMLFVSHGVKVLTGLQIIELPEPPPVPGITEEQPPVVQPPAQPPVNVSPPSHPAVNISPPEEVSAPVAVPGEFSLESRVAMLEKSVAGLQQQLSRVDTLESQMQGLNTDAENMRNFMSRPVVEQPAFFEGLGSIQSSIKRNAILSVSLSVFILLIVIGIIANLILQRKRESEEEKRLVKQYLDNYSKQGYKLETLRMHLRSSGWSDEVIQEAMRELQKR